MPGIKVFIWIFSAASKPHLYIWKFHGYHGIEIKPGYESCLPPYRVKVIPIKK